MISASTRLTIFCDGGSRGNPGPAACAFVAMIGDEIAFEQGTYLGPAKTNNEAEYLAVIASLKWLQTLADPPASVTWQLDSLLVVEQLSGHWKVKDHKMKILCQECFRLLGAILPQRTYVFRHIPRELNAHADALVNHALDHRLS